MSITTSCSHLQIPCYCFRLSLYPACYPSAYYTVIRDRGYFPFRMAFCNSLLWFACMKDESTPWHTQAKEEMCWNSEMALQPCLCSSPLDPYPNCQ
jgi:hypothetical protein